VALRRELLDVTDAASELMPAVTAGSKGRA
jgi:hypothetical protein